MIVSTNEIVVGWKVTGQAELERMAQTFNKVTEEEKEALAELKKVNSQLKQVGTEGQKAGNNIADGIKKADQETTRFSGSLKGIGAAITAAFSVAAVVSFGREVFKTTALFQQYQKVLDFTAGSQAQGAVSMQHLVNTSNKLGISLIAAIEGFKTLSGAATQAGISNNQTRKIFDNVAKSVAAFGLSSEDAKGVFLALGQIISKGTVSAEELRGQIGERIPGAFSIAAKSMNVTEAELNKLLQTGKITAKEFVIPFTQALADASEKADGKDGLTQRVNKISNAFEILKTRIGRGLLGPTGQVGDLLVRALNAANKLLGNESDNKAVVQTKAYEQAIKDAENASNGALKTSINNTNAKIRAAKEEFDLINERVTIDGKLEDDEKDQLDRQRQFIERLRAYRDGLFDSLKGRKENNVEIIKTNAELKKEFDLRMQILEVEKQIRIEAGERANNPNARIMAEEKFLRDKLSTQKEFAQKGMGISKNEIYLTSLQQQNAAKEIEDSKMNLYKADKKTEEDIFKLRSKSLEDQSKVRDGWMKENDKQRDSLLQKEEDEIRYIAKLRKEAGQQAIGLAQDSVNAIFNIRQQALQNELVISNRRYDEEIRLADGNEQKINQINEKRAAKEKEVAMKQFRAQQMQAIANAAFQAAPYIVKYSAGLPFTAVNLGLTLGALATQTAFILSQPVPEFYKGVENFKGGLAMVGERGSEIIETNKGSYLSPDKPTLTYLPKGSNVITAPKTKERMQMLNSSMRKGQNEFVSIDTTPIARELSKMPVAINKFDERGFTEFVKKGNRTTQILNRRKGY